jgi:hypothetical protein
MNFGLDVVYGKQKLDVTPFNKCWDNIFDYSTVPGPGVA